MEINPRLKFLLKKLKFDWLYYYMRNNVFINKIAVPAEKDLSLLKPVDELLEKSGVKLVTLTEQTFNNGELSLQPFTYLDKDRQKTALAYLEKGYRGVAVVDGNEVCGDIWYTNGRNQHPSKVHPDLKWLKMTCREDEAYAFDMYLNPASRGKNLANLLQGGVLHQIKKEGFSKALGYYWADNIPALWVHRTLKWKERNRVSVSRVFCFHFSHEHRVSQPMNQSF